MKEKQLPNGDFEWTFFEDEDGDIIDGMKRLAEEWELEINSEEFNEKFVEHLISFTKQLGEHIRDNNKALTDLTKKRRNKNGKKKQKNEDK
jgi:hypothetical protein